MSDVGKSKKDVPLVISSAPKEIWLDLGFDPAVEGNVHFSTLTEVTWSEDNATGHGVRYVQADTDSSAPQEGVEEVDAIGPAVRSMFVARLEKMGEASMSPSDVLALLKDCDFMASFVSKTPRTRPGAASFTRPDEATTSESADTWYAGAKFAMREVLKQNKAAFADEKILSAVVDACRSERNRIAAAQDNKDTKA